MLKRRGVFQQLPMAKALVPARLDIAAEFARGFDGMTETPISLDELIETREFFIERIVHEMPENYRQFLMSAKRGQPNWSLIDLPSVESLPAVQRRLENMGKLDQKRRDALIERLGEVLGILDPN
ncbi:MAG: hypothetical protein ACLGRW_09790 [Acidobacteriota bacterium]